LINADVERAIDGAQMVNLFEEELVLPLQHVHVWQDHELHAFGHDAASQGNAMYGFALVLGIANRENRRPSPVTEAEVHHLGEGLFLPLRRGYVTLGLESGPC
jgi:hypothetical protein